MKKISILILESDEENGKKLCEYFSKRENFELIGSADDGIKGLEFIDEFSPDGVICSLLLKNLDGSGVIERAKDSGYDGVFIVMGDFTDDKIVNRIMSKGADYYMLKPFNPEIAEKQLLECMEEKHGKPMPKKIDEEISDIFISIGIPPHIKGYNYLREGIKMTVARPSIINCVTKELYPKIGEKFETSASKVERAIRHAIEVAWNRGRIDAINAVFGARVYIGTEKPTNSEFIALVADKLLLENL